MKYFYLKFTQDDFIKNGQSWVTNIINLRNNTQYKNYSVHKSKYGLTVLGDVPKTNEWHTWTGMEHYDVDDQGATPVIPTSSGFIENDRFIDTTAHVDVTRHSFNFADDKELSVDYTVRYYSSNDSDDKFPDFWEVKDVPRGRNIYRVDTDDYARFEIVWGDDFDPIDIEFEYVVQVEIDEPQIDAMFARTRSMLDVFPEWMAIRDDAYEPATPALAKPDSVGGALINAVAGDTLEDIRTSMIYLKTQMFLTMANDNQKAWIYILEEIPDHIYSIKGDGIELARTANAKEFYESDDDDDAVFFMDFGKVLWINKPYTEISINGQVQPPVDPPAVDVENYEAKLEEYNNRLTYAQLLEPTHVWNWFDEHGLLFDLRRLHLESNDSFRKRILDVFVNMPNFSLEGVKRSLRRELNLWLTYHDATPDSYALGATPTLIELEDIERSPEYFDADGMPTETMNEFVLWLSNTYPSTWGFLRWGNALWPTSEGEGAGYSVLPWRFDAESDVPLDAGVGDLDDLYVFRPDEIELTTTFDYQLQIKGLEFIETKLEWRKAKIPLAVTGRREVAHYTDRAQGDITVWVTANDITYWANVHLDSGPADPSLTPILDRITADVTLLDSTNQLTKHLDWGIDGSDEIVYSLNNANENIEVSADDITDVAVSWGWDFDLSSTDPDNPPEEDYGYLVFSEEATPSTLPANSDGTRLYAEDVFSDVIRLVPTWENDTPESMVVETEEVYSEPQMHTVEVNGGSDNQKKPGYYKIPRFQPSEFTVEDSERVEIQILEGAGSSENAAGEAVEIPASNIELNGSNAWTDASMTLDYDVDNRRLEFTTIDDPPSYPTEYDVWEPFQATSLETYEGVVDENGAWLGGVRPDMGQTNTRVQYHRLDRDDFGLPHTEDYSVTWMGVVYVTPHQSDEVVVYLDTNTVRPAVAISELTYPDGAIVEVLDVDDNKYVFSEFYSHAKKIYRANPQWNPFINSGWMYDMDDEYYLYADKRIETFDTDTFKLEKQPSLGAPIIVRTDEATPVEYRQVAFIEDYATPNLVDRNIEIVSGNGTSDLYLSFEDVFNVTVTELYTNRALDADEATESNVLPVGEVTSFDVEYEVSYRLNRSYIAKHGEVGDDGDLTTEISITEVTPFGGYEVIYEGSEYNFATPVDIPLNPAYTLREEGFIFVCFDEFEYSFVQVKLSPGTIASTEEDYALVSLQSKDIHGNSKAEQSFDITTNWGTLSESSVTTDKDGYAFTILTGVSDTTRTQGKVTILKDSNPVGNIGFRIGQVAPPQHKLIALPSANSMPADGTSRNFIFGRVIGPDNLPVPYAVVSYRRGLSVQDVFAEDYQGQTVSDSFGRFTIGPIVSATPEDPRTVFYAIESWGTEDASPATPGEAATPDFDMPVDFGPVGDMVYWREFPAVTKGLNELNYLSTDTFIYNQESSTFLSNTEAFPMGHDESAPLLDATPNPELEWSVPGWYAINAYKQYQLGMRGDTHHEADYYYEGSHPDYKEL